MAPDRTDTHRCAESKQKEAISKQNRNWLRNQWREWQEKKGALLQLGGQHVRRSEGKGGSEDQLGPSEGLANAARLSLRTAHSEAGKVIS